MAPAGRAPRVRWTPERVEWLRREAPEWTAPQLARRFEREFFVRVSAMAIHCAAARFGIEIGAEATWRSGRPKRYRAADEAWFREAARGRTRTELAQAFAARYGGRADIHRVRSFAALRGIRLSELCERAPNNGRFCPERPGIEDAPVGSRKVLPARMRGGYLQRPIPVVKVAPGARGWEREARVAWEREHGRPVPAGCVVLQLDGDELNCEPENLELVSRRVLALLNKRGEFASAPAEFRRTLVRAAQLEVAAKRRAEELAA